METSGAIDSYVQKRIILKRSSFYQKGAGY